MSFRSQIVGVALVASGNHRRWQSAAAFTRSVDKRPVAISRAPRSLTGVTISSSVEGGWSIVTLLPAGRRSTGTVVYLPGGGYAFDIISQHWSFLADMVRRTARRVVVVRYPLAPVGQAEDVVPHVADIVAAQSDHGPVSIAGDSAGGGLALAAALVLRDRGATGIPLMLLSPWVDITMDHPSVAAAARLDPWLAPPGLRAAGDLYRGTLAADDPRVSPINGDLTGLGPVVITSGTHDVLNADARRLAAALRVAGVPVDFIEAAGLLHNYPLMPIPEAKGARRALFGTLTGPTPA